MRPTYRGVRGGRARGSPDGYTLLLVDPTASINATLYEKLNYNFIRDIASPSFVSFCFSRRIRWRCPQ
jgi:hypothetical protein